MPLFAKTCILCQELDFVPAIPFGSMHVGSHIRQMYRGTDPDRKRFISGSFGQLGLMEHLSRRYKHDISKIEIFSHDRRKGGQLTLDPSCSIFP